MPIVTIAIDDNGDAFIPLPNYVLLELGWVEDDEIVIDIPTAYQDQLILWKKEKVQ